MKTSRIVFCLIFVTLCAATLPAQRLRITDAQFEQLNGNVSEVVSMVFGADNDRHVAEKGAFISGRSLKFDRSGMCRESCLLASDEGDIAQKTTYEYAGSSKTSAVTTDINGNVIYHQNFKNDSEGYCVAIEFTNSAGAPISRSEMEYDRNKIRTTELFADEWRSITTYVFDGNCRITRVTATERDCESDVSIVLDLQGFVAKKIRKSGGRQRITTSYKYEADSHGNWTKQIEYLNDKPTQITYRTIKYY